MEKTQIQGMLKALKPALKNIGQAEIILEKYWSEKLALVWTVHDIHKAANERGLALTRKEARELLNDLRIHYNRQHGIKWTDLWDLIDDSDLGRKMTKQEVKAFVCQGSITLHV